MCVEQKLSSWKGWMRRGVLSLGLLSISGLHSCEQAWAAGAQLPPAVNNPSTPAVAQTSIDSVAPLRGLTGSNVTITGRNLNLVTGVFCNGRSATIRSKTATSIVAIVPAGATTGRITLVTPNNGSPVSREDYVVVAPEVTTFTPESGPPGTMVRLSGVGLDGARAVRFGTRTAPVEFASETQIAARVPSGATSGLIGVTVAGQEPKTRASFTVTAAQVAPTLSSIAPASGAPGANVQLTGTNLGAVTGVRFNGVPASFDVASSRLITTVVPPTARTGRVTLIWSGSTTPITSTTNFTVTGTANTGGGVVVRTIVGRVTNRVGVGIPNVRIIWTGPVVNGAETGDISLLTDSAGNYVIRELRPGVPLVPGVYRVAVQTRGFTFAPLIQQVTVGNGSIGVPTFIGTANPATFTVSGKVLDFNNQALGGVLVIAYGDRDPRRFTLGDALAYALTDDTGAYSFRNVPIDFYTIAPLKGGYRFETQTRRFVYASGLVSQLIYVTANLPLDPFKATNAPVRPANDSFVAARPIAGVSGRLMLSNTGATRELGEPAHGAGIPAAGSLWYRWTAPASGRVTFTTLGSTYAPEYRQTAPMDTSLASYTGSGVNGLSSSVRTLTQLASNDNVSSGTSAVYTSSIEFGVVAGRNYYIAADGAYAVHGNINLNWSMQTVAPTPTPRPVAAPANDLFARAQVLAGATGRVSGRNTNATVESGEPRHAGANLGRSVWYVWRAPFNGTASFETVSGTNYDTVIAAYSGSTINALTALNSNDDQATGNPLSKITFAVTANTTYHIAVDGFNNAATGQGNFILGWNATVTRGPINDNLSNATTISGASGRINGLNTGATEEDFEDGLGGLVGGRSIWYAWTAPSSGSVTFTTAGTRFDTLLSVFRYVPQPESFTAVASNDDDLVLNATTSRVTFNAVAGGIYFFALDGYNGAQGATVLNWGNGATPTPTPAARLTLSISPTSFSESAGSAAARGTVTRTAPASFALTVALSNSNPSQVIVPSSVTIPAGALSATFNVGAVNDTVVDGTQTATIGASASGFTSATATVSVTDNDASNARPTNDDFERPFIIGGVSGRVNGSNVGATPQAFENGFDDFHSHSVWFIWTAPSSQTYTFNTLGSNFDTTLLVFSVEPSTRETFFVDSNDDAVGATSSVSFNAAAGTTYYFAIDGYEDSPGVGDFQGNYILNWSAGGSGAARAANASVATSKSFSSASAAGQEITLAFTSPLDNQTAAETGNFEVSVDGIAVEIEAVAFNAATRRVVLQLPHAMKSNSKVKVSWPGLRDAQSRAITPDSVLVTAR